MGEINKKERGNGRNTWKREGEWER